MTASNPTHCLDCYWCVPAGSPKGCCANPAVVSLDDLERAVYDDPEQACPVFEAKELMQ